MLEAPPPPPSGAAVSTQDPDSASLPPDHQAAAEVISERPASFVHHLSVPSDGSAVLSVDIPLSQSLPRPTSKTAPTANKTVCRFCYLRQNTELRSSRTKFSPVLATLPPTSLVACRFWSS